MNLKKYKLKITAFVVFVIFLMIFFTGVSFLFYRQYKESIFSNKTLTEINKKIKNYDTKSFLNFIDFFDNLYVSGILGNVISNNDFKLNKTIQNYIGVKYIDIRKYNNEIIFQNFNIENCNKKFYCKSFKKDDFVVTIAIKANENLFIKYNILLFGILSFLISILFFPLIYWIVNRITKPVEKNFEFMKNFVNNAGHELKTPIANISLSSQILLQKQSFDKEIIQDIVNESNKISKLIDTLLQMSILSKFENKKNINLKEKIENILNEFNLELQNYDLNKKTENITIKANTNHLDILLRNLIKNAIKYNNEKKYIGIILNKNKLIIENSGPEIKNGEKKKIFDLFYRIEKNKEGYGLGLSLVKKIVEINKWNIKVESKDGINKFIVEF